MENRPIPAHGTTGLPPGRLASETLPGDKAGPMVQPVPSVRLVPDKQPTDTVKGCAIDKRSGTQSPGPAASLKPHRGGIDFSDPQLPINFIAADYIPLEKQMPRPPFSPELKRDTWLDWVGSKPTLCEAPDYVNGLSSMDYVNAQLQIRQQVEEAGGRFQFRPFMATLENMQEFIHHIQAGRQFPDPLSAPEVAALTRLEAQTTALVEAGTPYYKDTVGLSLSLQVICELITERQVLEPLRNDTPDLGNWVMIRLRCPLSEHPCALAALPWTPPATGDMPPCAEAEILFRCRIEARLAEALFDTVHDRNILLYPSFQPLTLENFGRFSHLPLYPVGLATDYVSNADGFMMSPLSFANHDLEHMYDLREKHDAPATGVEVVLASGQQRLVLRQLLLDDTPTWLAGQQLEPALILLLFSLVHENAPSDIAREIADAQSAFWYFLETLLRARRQSWTGYSEEDRRYSDEEAAMAALWTASLWARWQQEGQPLTAAQVLEHARSFTRQEAPRLRQHLDFVAQHRGTLRQLFIDSWALDLMKQDDSHHWFTVSMPPKGRSLTLFQSYDGIYYGSGLCNLDNTELAWFGAQQLPDLRQKIEKATRAHLPDTLSTPSIL